MREDLGDHDGIYDGGDDRQGAAAVGAVFNIDSEHPFEQPGPAQAPSDGVRHRGLLTCHWRPGRQESQAQGRCLLGAPRME